jgi:hypothetical protein
MEYIFIFFSYPLPSSSNFRVWNKNFLIRRHWKKTYVHTYVCVYMCVFLKQQYLQPYLRSNDGVPAHMNMYIHLDILNLSKDFSVYGSRVASGQDDQMSLWKKRPILSKYGALLNKNLCPNNFMLKFSGNLRQKVVQI